MAYIQQIEPDDAAPALREAYAKVAASRGRVANVLKVHSVNPAAMTAHLELYRTLMFARAELTRVEREAMAVAVSAANACAYCVAHHSAALGTAGGDPALVDALARDPEGAALDERTRALVTFALRLTRTPAAMTEDDVRALRTAGLSDAAIHNATAVAAYYNFVNRMVHGLGVELEPGGGW